MGDYIPSELKNAAYEFLSGLRQVITSEIEVRTRVEIGEPSEEIVNVTAQGVDLVVMGTRGFGSFDETTSGSVADYVAKNCPKPVIFAKDMPSDWDEDNNLIGGDYSKR